MMENVKNFFASRTIWGGLVALLAGLLALLGYSVDLADQAYILEALTALASSFGGILAVYGRVKATKKIKGS